MSFREGESWALWTTIILKKWIFLPHKQPTSLDEGELWQKVGTLWKFIIERLWIESQIIWFRLVNCEDADHKPLKRVHDDHEDS